MQRQIAVLAAALFCGAARADYPVQFIQAICAPELDYFEIAVTYVNNRPGLYSDNPKARGSGIRPAVAASLRKKGIVILLEPGTLHCTLEGMRITVVNTPYQATERRPFPGSRLSLSINGRLYASSVALGHESGRPSLYKVQVNGTDYVSYMALASLGSPVEYNIFQKFEGKGTVTDRMLDAFGENKRYLSFADDGSVR